MGKMDFLDNHFEFLGIMDAIGSGARYHKDLAVTRKIYPRNIAQEYLTKTEEILEWIQKDPIFKQS